MKHKRRRNGAILVAAVAIAATGLLFWAAPARDRDAGPDAAAHDGVAADSRAGNHAGTPAGAEAGTLQPRTDTPPIPAGLPPVDPADPPEYATNLPLDTLYAPHPQAKAHFADKLPFAVDERTYVEFNRRALATLRAGSTLTLRTPDDGKPYTVGIDEIQVHPNGDKSWIGHVQDPTGEVLPAVFTQGRDSSFGSINTRSGTYSLEAEGRLGWIANVNTLRSHQDFDQPDVMVPDPGKAPTAPGQP